MQSIPLPSPQCRRLLAAPFLRVLAELKRRARAAAGGGLDKPGGRDGRGHQVVVVVPDDLFGQYRQFLQIIWIILRIREKNNNTQSDP